MLMIGMRRVAALALSFASLQIAQQPTCTRPPSGLVDWWPGDGSSKDIIGPNDGSAASFEPGKVGAAFTFDGIGGVSLGAAGAVGRSDFTIDFWLKSSSTNTQGVLGKRVFCSTSPFYDIRIMSAADFNGAYPGRLLIELQDGLNGYEFPSSRRVNDGLFHFIALVRQNLSLSLYIDGALDFAETAPYVIDPSNSGVLSAGVSACNGNGPNRPLTGQMDEIEFFDHALTLSEIQSIFRADTAGKLNPHDIYISLGNVSLDKKPETITATFIPGASNLNPTGLQEKADQCGFERFDWVQTITAYPSPSVLFAQSSSSEVPSANQPISIPPLSAIHDPPPGGFTYQFPGNFQVGTPLWSKATLISKFWPNVGSAWPFYYSPLDLGSCAMWDDNGNCTTNITDTTTLTFFDVPTNPCIFGGPGAFMAACNYGTPINPAFVQFTTQLVGICGSNASAECASPGKPSAPLFEWSWQSDFNGNSLGGIDCTSAISCPVQTSSGALPMPGSGTGGITITNINGVPLPPAELPSQVAVIASGLAYSRVSQTFNGTVTVSNISAGTISRPLQVILFGLRSNVTLMNASGSLSGTPYITISAPNSLAPGQSITVPLQFKNPSNVTINLTPAIYSGSISQ